MLSFSGSLKVFLAVKPCDLRKSFNGLHALVSGSLGEDPHQGALFVFCNRRRTRWKVLYWDGTGLWVLIKRLEKGTFWWPDTSELGFSKCKRHTKPLLTRCFGPGCGCSAGGLIRCGPPKIRRFPLFWGPTSCFLKRVWHTHRSRRF